MHTTVLNIQRPQQNDAYQLLSILKASISTLFYNTRIYLHRYIFSNVFFKVHKCLHHLHSNIQLNTYFFFNFDKYEYI